MYIDPNFYVETILLLDSSLITLVKPARMTIGRIAMSNERYYSTNGTQMAGLNSDAQKCGCVNGRLPARESYVTLAISQWT